MKLRTLFYLATFLSIAIISCKKDDDDDNVDDFDHAAQAIVDKEILVDYLKSHYYIAPLEDEYFGKIDTILETDNVTSLFDDIKLKKYNVTYNDIDYEYYSYEQEIGTQGIKASKADSVMVRYQGVLLDKSEEFDRSNFFNWFGLYNAGNYIVGFREGMQYFSGGENASVVGEPIKFTNTGKGFFIIPSGLGYRNIANGDIPASSCLVFHVDMGYVIIADNDNDGLTNIEEDLDGDGEAYNDDTDEDGYPNFVDAHDDNDGTLTKDESKTEDAVGDGIVAYLDPDAK